MRPIKFTEKNGIIHFHYKASELRNFARLGFRHGDVGMILVRREGNFLTYKGFGTIEHPVTDITTITINHFPAFDGEMPTDQQRVTP